MPFLPRSIFGIHLAAFNQIHGGFASMTLNAQWLSKGVLPCLAGIRMSPKKEKQPHIYIVRSIYWLTLLFKCVEQRTSKLLLFFLGNAVFSSDVFEQTTYSGESGAPNSMDWTIQILLTYKIHILRFRYTINLNQQTLFEEFKHTFQIIWKYLVLTRSPGILGNEVMVDIFRRCCNFS